MNRILTVLLVFTFFAAHAQNEHSTYYNEPYRPQFHFTPEAHWMNDPNGLVFFNGNYHMFYQYYPDGNVWGPMHWGHAVSTDLVHWEHRPIALYPDKLGWIFSGSVVIDANNTAGFGKNAMIAIFTYHNDEIWKSGKKNTESQGLAYSLDEGKTWKKYEQNPVLNNSGEQDFRDPKVFWHSESNSWKMVLAAGDKIKLFSSANLKNWTFESDFKPDADNKDLGVWECPDLFPMNCQNTGEVKWVMLVNHGDKCPNGGSGTRYFVGNFDGKKFQETQKAIWLDAGTDFYAAVTYSNTPTTKRILQAWMSNWQYATKVPTEVWRSAMTLPRELTLVKNQFFFSLKQQPVSQFKSITSPLLQQEKVKLPYQNNALDLSQSVIEIDFEYEKVRDLTLSFSNKAGDKYEICLANGMVTTNRKQSGQIRFSDAFAEKPQNMSLAGNKPKKMQLILDRSSVEILVNEGAFSMTNLFFPGEPYTQLEITSSKGKFLKRINIEYVNRIWKK